MEPLRVNEGVLGVCCCPVERAIAKAVNLGAVSIAVRYMHSSEVLSPALRDSKHLDRASRSVRLEPDNTRADQFERKGLMTCGLLDDS